MSEAQTGAATAAPEPAAIAPAQTAEPTNVMDALTQTMSAAYDKINPAREAGGQFKAADDNQEQPAEGAAQASDTPAEQTTDQTQAKAPEPASQAIEAPLSWSAEMKAKWATLPPEAQTYIAQRESEAHKRISELGQTTKALEPVRAVIDRHVATFQKYGVSPDAGIDQLMGYFAESESNPRAFIERFAANKGISLYQQEGDQSAHVRSLEARLANAERLANEAASRVTARERSELERAQATLASTIENFAKDKPDFAEVENDMLAHVQAIRTAEPDLAPEKILEKAFEAARWGNPVVRARMLEKQRSDEEAKRATEAKKKAEEAKKAASLNVKSGQASPARKGNWEQTLREVGERIAS